MARRMSGTTYSMNTMAKDMMAQDVERETERSKLTAKLAEMKLRIAKAMAVDPKAPALSNAEYRAFRQMEARLKVLWLASND